MDPIPHLRGRVEQPGTAAETPDFEPLVKKAEEQIAKMRVP